MLVGPVVSLYRFINIHRIHRRIVGSTRRAPFEPDQQTSESMDVVIPQLDAKRFFVPNFTFISGSAPRDRIRRPLSHGTNCPQSR